MFLGKIINFDGAKTEKGYNSFPKLYNTSSIRSAIFVL